MPRGPYGTSARLLEDIAEVSGGHVAAGVAGYPEGHPKQSQLHMLDALLHKQHLASSVVISRKGPLARRLFDGGNYSPRRLVSELSGVQPALAGVHLCTFNNLEPYASAPRLR